MGDTGIKYKSTFQRVELMIENVSSLGFDVSEYEKILREINDQVSNNIMTVKSSEKMVQGRLDQIYFDGMMRLKRVELMLENYSVYFEVLNNCKYLDIKIKKEEINQGQLEEYVSQMIYNLKRIVKSDTVNYDKEKYIVEKVYDTAYQIIKLELIKTGDSQLYHYAKNEDVNLSFFNKLILKDISELTMDENNYENIQTKIYKLNSSGIASNYFDLELIKLLLVHDKDNNLIDLIVHKLEDLEKQIISTNDTVNKVYEDAKRYDERVIDFRKDLKKSKKEVFKRVISTLLTYAIIITGGIGIERFVRKIETKDSYLKTTEIYSSLDDTTIYSEPEKVFNKEVDRDVYIREYEPWQQSFWTSTHRKYREYNVSHVNLDTAYDYYDYGLDNYDVEYLEDKEYLDDGVSVDDLILYQDNYIEVLMNQYEYDGVSLDKNNYFAGLLICYLGYLGLLVLVIFIREHNTGCYFETSNLIEAIEDLKIDRKYYNDNYQLLQDKVNELMKIINSNEEYRNKFRDLYEENKFLLDNPEELYRRINELGQLERIENAKKLVRENKKKK